MGDFEKSCSARFVHLINIDTPDSDLVNYLVLSDFSAFPGIFSMGLYFYGSVFVLVSTVLAVLGMLLVRKRVGVKNLAGYHEVAGYLLSVIGTLYAVLLGFIVVDAMGKQQELRVIVEKEASGVANIFLASYGLKEESRSEIQDTCYRYATAVINEEWDAMERGSYSAAAFEEAWKLWKEITELKTADDDERAIREQILSEMCQMTENRRTRLVTSRTGMAPVMWVVLIVGGVFTVLFTYFFGVDNLKAHVLMTVLVALTLSLNVFLVFIFAYPVSGDIGVRPEAFKMDLLIFKHFQSGKIPQNQSLPSR